jgi:hypothetical protein
MKTFTDALDRSWQITINVSAVKRVRQALDVNLLDVAGGDLLGRLADDPCLLVDVLYVLCRPEADAKGVSDEDFGRAMVGDALDGASSALMKELLDFFPRAQRARALAKMVLAMNEQKAEIAEAAAALKPLAEAEAAAKTPGDSSGGSPASAASTPDP